MTYTSSAPGAVRSAKPRTGAVGDSTRSFTQLSHAVKDMGLLRRARTFYIILFAGLCLALGGIATGMVLLGESWFQLLMAAALGIVLTQFAFLAHEASHRQVFSSGPANDRAGRTLATAFVGMSYQWWMTKHSRHHANPNKIGKDPDIDPDTVVFTEEDAASRRGFLRFLTRKQGYYFFPLLLLFGINLHFVSVKSLAAKGDVKGRWIEIGTIAVRFAAYLTAIFLLMPVGMAFAFLGVQLAVFGLYMGSSFAPNHVAMPLVGRDEKLDFFTKQVRTSRNVSGGFWASVLMGGLNYQIEHHLFPNMPRPFLAKAREIVREHAATTGVHYEETSFVRAQAIVIDYLNRVGLAARAPFECPMVMEYRRN